MMPNPVIPSEKRIVVTGAAGFIGRRVVGRLAGMGVRVTALDLVPRPVDLPVGVDYSSMDLSGTDAGVPVGDILIHLAWNMDRTDEEGQIRSLDDFSRLLASRPWSGVVGLGSAEEYGEREGRLVEDMAPGCSLSSYGAAKHHACRALQAWADCAPRKAIWLRPFVVYGPGQHGNMAIPYALRCARERMPADFSEGMQLRDFAHVDDVADGIVAATMALPLRGEAFTACNLGCGEPVRLRDVLERIAVNAHAQELFRFGVRAMRSNEPHVQYAATDVAASFGWRARIPWQNGIDLVCKQELDAHA